MDVCLFCRSLIGCLIWQAVYYCQFYFYTVSLFLKLLERPLGITVNVTGVTGRRGVIVQVIVLERGCVLTIRALNVNLCLEKIL